MKLFCKYIVIVIALLLEMFCTPFVYGQGENYVRSAAMTVRAVLNEQGELTQATDYSAYGVPSTRYADTAANNHLHLGLEWQPMKGVSGYYNNARFRDALLAGMFYQQDPLAEKYYPFSPYHYGMNNPLRYSDYNGKEVVFSENNSCTI